MAKDKKAVIIGAGPAGLTAAYELLTRTKIRPIIIEKSEIVGGIAATINHNGNRLDIGGHRFFTKSDRVLNWWLEHLPLQKVDSTSEVIVYHKNSRTINSSVQGPDPEKKDNVFLIRDRKSRILYKGRLFSYPIRFNIDTLSKLGIMEAAKIISSYSKSVILPIKPERNLEDFFINRFGSVLYQKFFKTYTEKVWGTSCKNLSPEWGVQRVKNLSVSKALVENIKKVFSVSNDLAQKNTETSLIEKFLYPKYGPGQLWEKVANDVSKMGGTILRSCEATRINITGNRVKSATVINRQNKKKTIVGDYFFSSMSVKDLVGSIDPGPPSSILKVSDGLQYRDFLVVGLLLNKMQVGDESQKDIDDNWIYVHESYVDVGRIQFFNNWSRYLVKDPKKMWIGMEYFCNMGDSLWEKSDKEIINYATTELEKLGFASGAEVEDGIVVKTTKAYPSYTGTYNKFGKIRDYLDKFDNLFLVGRNGMHKYNNQDHSILTAMVAVDNIILERKDKSNIWVVNTESEYHEEKKQTET